MQLCWPIILLWPTDTYTYIGKHIVITPDAVKSCILVLPCVTARQELDDFHARRSLPAHTAAAGFLTASAVKIENHPFDFLLYFQVSYN